MNIRQIRYFATAVEEGSFSAVAKKQYVTLQAVSKAIADLERETGYDLFVRESRGVHPTAFGSAFYDETLDVLGRFDDLEHFPEKFRMWNDRADTMNICLCSPKFYGSDKACAKIEKFIEQQMHISVHVAMGTTEFGIEGLHSGAFAAIVSIGTVSSDDLECVPIGTVPPIVTMLETHPLAQRTVVSLDDLDGYEIGYSTRFPGLNKIISSLFAKYDKTFEQRPCDTLEAVGDLYANNGVTFALGVLSLGEYYPGTLMKRMDPDQEVGIPICLVNLTGCKDPMVAMLVQVLLGHLVNTAMEC